MPYTYADVADEVVRQIPEFRAIRDDHLKDYGEVLQHVPFGDLSRFIVEAHARGESGLVERTQHLMERLMTEGDELTVELVAVSFVENIAPEDADEAFFDLYGPQLRAHFERYWGDPGVDGLA